MARKFSKKDRQKQRKIFIDSLFDARTNPEKTGAHKMKKTVYKNLLEGIRKRNLQQKELRNKVETEMQNYLECVVLPNYGIKKDWHVHLHTQKRVIK